MIPTKNRIINNMVENNIHDLLWLTLLLSLNNTVAIITIAKYKKMEVRKWERYIVGENPIII